MFLYAGSPTPGVASSSSSYTGAIVGGVVGGIVAVILVVIIIIVVYMLFCRNKGKYVFLCTYLLI